MAPNPTLGIRRTPSSLYLTGSFAPGIIACASGFGAGNRSLCKRAAPREFGQWNAVKGHCLILRLTQNTSGSDKVLAGQFSSRLSSRPNRNQRIANKIRL